MNETFNNLSKEKKILEQMLALETNKQNLSDSEKKFIDAASKSLLEQLSIINNSTKEIIFSLSSQKKPEKEKIIPGKGKKENLIIEGQQITINKEDKLKLIDELKLSQKVLGRLKKTKIAQENKVEQQPVKFVSFSSSIFLKKALSLSKSEFFAPLKKNIKKANMSMLFSSYLSTMFLTTVLSFVFAFILALLISFISITYPPGAFFPTVSFSLEGIVIKLARNIAFAILVPVITFLIFYLSPQSQASSIRTKIDNELPFAIIHMSAIAGSGVEPVKVFNILAASPEYPAFSSEIKKIMNMINLYGYDLVSALKETSKLTSSEKLASLLTGMANITVSGGDLREYLEKKSADTLLDYKLQKKTEAEAAETSMDLYIGILIAAPLILMVMLVIMGAVPGLGFKGISTLTLSYLVIIGIALLNIGFLAFLKMKRRS